MFSLMGDDGRFCGKWLRRMRLGCESKMQLRRKSVLRSIEFMTSMTMSLTFHFQTGFANNSKTSSNNIQVQYCSILHTFTRYSSFHSSREPGSCFSWEAMGCALQLFREIAGERICHRLPLTSKISQETQEIARETQPLGSSCPWALRDWSWAQIPTVSRGLPVHQAKPTKAPSIWCQGEPDLHTKWANHFAIIVLQILFLVDS